MQIIRTILKLSGGNAETSDEYGKKESSPEVKIGIAAILEADLRSKFTDESTGELLPYPYDELAGADSFYLCLDGDWDHDTQPKLIRTSGISIHQSEDGRTIFRAELPQTALPELLAVVEKKQSATLVAEICGYKAVDGTASAIFAWSFNLVLQNRLFIGNPPEEVVNNPEYLTASEVMALIAEATRPVQNPGPQGDSAYAVAVAEGYEGTREQWLESLKVKGDAGLTAYQVAVVSGYEGTVTEWLADLEGESAYEAAVAEGYTGTREQWLESLKGADGKGLEFDATGTFMQKSLYDDKPAGFKFATTVVDSTAQKTTLYVYAKNSEAYGDWCEPIVIVFYSPPAATVARIAPVEFTAPEEGDNKYLFFNLASYPFAHVTQVVIDTADGELALPYWSDQGVRKILRKNNIMNIYFGNNLPTHTKGRVYLSQMVASTEQGDSIDSSYDMYYGYIINDEITSVSEITEEMLSQATMHRAPAGVIVKQSLGVVPVGAWIVVLVPPGFSASKFDGISAKVPFADNVPVSGTGANGSAVEIDGKSYKLYGEFQLTTSEKFIYIDVI